MRLTEATEEREYTVTSLSVTDDHMFPKLLALGVFPGAKLRVLQKQPCHICAIGSCRLAIDCALAKYINVK